MIDGKECVEVIKKLKQLSEDEIKKLIEEDQFNTLWIKALTSFFKIQSPLLYNLTDTIFKIETNKSDVLKFVLELKKNEKSLDKLSKEILKKEERIKFLEKKQSNIDEIVQEKISQQLKKYEEKIKQLEKENKELKEQLGYYG